jgi:voltage-gated potassium channel
MNTFKKRIYDILSVSSRKGDASWYCDMFIITLISFNTLALVLESIPTLHGEYAAAFYWFEVFSVGIFTVEYLLRLWTANVHPRFATPFWGNLRYAVTPLAIIDLIAVIPFYLPFVGVDLRVVRILRVFRLFRLFKVVRYIRALTLISQVFRQKRTELAISLVLTFFLLLIASSLVYFVEHDAQPEKFGSIPETMWWGIATLTTVGYGDVYPITGLGKLLGGLIAIMGVGLFALPAGILASGFAEAIAASKHSHDTPPSASFTCPLASGFAEAIAASKHSHDTPPSASFTCPHCGQLISRDDGSQSVPPPVQQTHLFGEHTHTQQR